MAFKIEMFVSTAVWAGEQTDGEDKIDEDQ
jgi:hypothetical protein